MAELTIAPVTDTLRDAFYVGVGAGVIAFQKLQVQRVELTKSINAQLHEANRSAADSLEVAKGSFDDMSELVEDRVKLLEERLGDVEHRLETTLADLEAKLPEQARDLVRSARDLVGRAA
ncbi:hypothetical protein BH23ACT2_BH23ACT2_18600 [soil metagenome]